MPHHNNLVGQLGHQVADREGLAPEGLAAGEEQHVADQLLQMAQALQGAQADPLPVDGLHFLLGQGGGIQ